MKTLTAEEIAELREGARLGDVHGPVPRLLDEVERSRALLNRIEWSGYDPLRGPVCPDCRVAEGFRHGLGCEIAALIGVPSGPRVATAEPQSDRDTGFSVPVEDE